jgi:transposase
VKDLPVSGTPVVMKLNIRRFFCDNETCSRKTFTERIQTVLEPYARKTNRLIETQRSIGFLSGGEPGSRISQAVSVSTSPDSLIRLVRSPIIATPKNSPAYLGIDDWAFKKGYNYGSILVDLETHRPIDLLPDRTPETVSVWLREHPGVKLVSRDRYSGFAEAVKKSAPEAIQVADRFHLLHNLVDMVERVVTRNYRLLQTVFHETFGPVQNSDTHPTEPQAVIVERQLTQYELLRLQIKAKHQIQHEEIQRLKSLGLGIRAISNQLNISREKVRRYLQSDQPPLFQRRKMKTLLDPYWDYLERRWRDGQRNGVLLFKEIQERGFPGTYRTMARQIRKLRAEMPRQTRSTAKKQPPHSKVIPKLRPFSTRQTAWLLVKKPEQLNDEQTCYRDHILATSDEFQNLHKLIHSFWEMVCQRKRENLDNWLREAKESGINELSNFAKGLQSDLPAVQAALEYPWSNGVVEGHNNRLKMIKRQMYGRAKFDLLRQRVLFQG